MFCTQCGAKNDEGSKFCTSCGHPFEELSPTVPQTPADASQATAQAPGPQTDQPAQETQVLPPQPQPAADQTQILPQQTPAAEEQPTQAMPPVRPVQNGQPIATTQAMPPVQSTPVQPAAPAIPTTTNAPAQAASQPTPKPKPKKKGGKGGKIVAIVMTVVLLLIAAIGATAYLTWRQGLWGGAILPQESSFTVQAGQQLTADVVADQLKSKGVKVEKQQIFSGKPKGGFVGYEGMQPGDRVQKDQTVTVQESAGPGVPDDVIGKQATDIAAEMSDMGVPVEYKQVVMSDQSQAPEGSVVVTSPQAGQPVEDSQKDKGISIGVATKGDGLGWDVIGQDADSVQSDLESQGYTVTVDKKLASSKYEGKVVDASPKPGSELSHGQSITLYEGVGADDLNDLIVSQIGGYETLYYSDAIAGTYCKATVSDPSKDCMTFATDGGDQGLGGTALYQTWGTEAASSPSEDDATSQCFATNGGDIGRCTIDDDGSYGFDVTYGAENRLAAHDWGAFDFGKGGEGAQCGSTTISAWFQSCSNGTASYSANGMGAGPFDGATYEMHDFFLYVAAGADLDSIESSGYFDADALAKAKGEKAADNDRPFILYRDPSLYDSTSVPVTKDNATDNPFVPSSTDTNDVKFKPAPTDANAYYLVEDVQPDWDDLPDADVSVPSPDASASPSASASATPTSLADIRKAAQGGDFSAIAGKYCMKDGTICLTLDKTGKITSSGSTGYAYMSPDDPTSAKLHVSTGAQGDTWFAPDPDVGIELRGPDSDYRCGGNKGYKACYQGSGSYSEAEITKPFDAVYIPAGVSSSKYETLGGSSYEDPQVQGKAKPDSSKPFLKIMGYHMNVPPVDSNVLYLVK
ncbi:PASTA domain-containing protein [Bifidobacterium avesanii]|uniref:PASTA domain-containing protein n=1 Tax=Bifidobacterium avesanii TaxID=1798157 RepID=UPI001383F8CB|nr:PASTA domain-containing protein [Bifidobacterium avesanii]KAB8292037.1 transmembrane serine/threonine- protein kinase B [Bifidobacterium avesanii]